MVQKRVSRARLTDHRVIVPGRVLTIRAYASVDELLDKCSGDDDIPFWAELWPSSRGLAQYLWTRDLTGLRVLELGAGVGLGGIAAALRGASVVQTDYVRRALAFARLNARRNQARGIRTVLGDWRNFPSLGEFDLIIGADILYEPSLHAFLRSVILRHIKATGYVILADPGRLAADNFVRAREREGWSWALDEVTLSNGQGINLITLFPPGSDEED